MILKEREPDPVLLSSNTETLTRRLGYRVLWACKTIHDWLKSSSFLRPPTPKVFVWAMANSGYPSSCQAALGAAMPGAVTNSTPRLQGFRRPLGHENTPHIPLCRMGKPDCHHGLLEQPPCDCKLSQKERGKKKTLLNRAPKRKHGLAKHILTWAVKVYFLFLQ